MPSTLGIAQRPKQADNWFLKHQFHQKTISSNINWRYALFFIGIHIPLALIMRDQPLVAATVGLIVISIAVFAVIQWRGTSPIHIYCAAYITGAEVLFRTVGSAGILPWEFGKYGVVLILGFALILRPPKTLPIWPFLYGFALLPSILPWLGSDAPIDVMRRRLVGNLAGPLAMALCAVYFSSIRFESRHLKAITLFFLAPAAGIATLCLFNVFISGEEIHFGRSSIRQASGGGGPNQVANALALATILCWLLMAQKDMRLAHRLFLGASMIGLIVPMIFTFSRSGFYTVVLVAIATSPFVLKKARQRGSFIFLGIVLAILMSEVIWPAISKRTSGAVNTRFASIESTRWDLSRGEAEAWLEHPFFGVGPGLARQSEFVILHVGRELQAHTEFSRLAAEHGAFGIIALICFFMGFLRCYRYSKTQEWKVWVVGSMVYVCAYWMQSATRTVAPSFVFGMIWAQYVSQSRPGKREGKDT